MYVYEHTCQSVCNIGLFSMKPWSVKENTLEKHLEVVTAVLRADEAFSNVSKDVIPLNCG